MTNHDNSLGISLLIHHNIYLYSCHLQIHFQDDNINPNLNGGPIEGFDISVYKVKTSFKLGTPPNFLWYNTTDPLNEFINDLAYNNFETHVWPACFPRDDDEYATDRGFIAGWLDLPPQIVRDPLQLGKESFSYQGVK